MSRFIRLLFYFSLFFNISCQKQEQYQTIAEEVFPPVTLKYAALNRLDNLPVSLTFFRDQWTLVIFGDSSCADDCQKRLALVNDVQSVNKLFVINGQAGHVTLRELARIYPEVAITMGVTASSFDNFYNQFDVDMVDSEDKHLYVYLISPTGDLAHILNVENLSAADVEKEISALKE